MQKLNRLIVEIESLQKVLIEEQNEVIYWKKLYEQKKEMKVEVPKPQVIEKIVKEPVFVEKEIPIYVDKEVEKIKYVDKPVYVDKEVFVDRVVEKPVEVPIYIDRPVEKIIEKEIVKTVEVESEHSKRAAKKAQEVPIYIEKEVPVYVE